MMMMLMLMMLLQRGRQPLRVLISAVQSIRGTEVVAVAVAVASSSSAPSSTDEHNKPLELKESK